MAGASSNLYNALRRIDIGGLRGEGRQLKKTISTSTGPTGIPDINISGLAPKPPRTGGRVIVGADRPDRSGASARSVSFRSAGVPENVSISKGGKKGFAKFGRNLDPSLGLASALSRVSDTNPFGINPADTTASAYAFKEGGFINKK